MARIYKICRGGRGFAQEVMDDGGTMDWYSFCGVFK
jgi:hypothetical protein